MKKIVLIISLLLLAFGIQYIPSAYAFATKSVCDVPITYRLGIIDKRFGVTSEEFLQDIGEAETVWEKPVAKNLYSYDPHGTLNINLIYDERQALHSEIDSMEGQLKNGKSTLDSQISEYESLVAKFKARLSALNDQISFWNSKGGAPPDEYDKLVTQQKDLTAEAEKLNAMARSLNLETNQYNSQVGSLNKTVDTFNQVLQGKPEEGLYIPSEKRIDIYFNLNHDEIVHTLAHEMGHARGMGHIAAKDAIMYSFTNRNIQASSGDILGMNTICEKNYLMEKTKEIISGLRQKYASNLN